MSPWGRPCLLPGDNRSMTAFSTKEEVARSDRISRARRKKALGGYRPDLPRTIAELDLAIELGWGETPQYRLPKDWRTRRKGER